MYTTRFDQIGKLFAARRLSRREALAKGSASLAAGALAAAGLGSAAAQEATPPAGEGTAGRTQFLFVQSFQSGSITSKEGADGTYTLTLEQGLGHTIYFSDRPERIVGATPTDQFLEGLGFAVDNPPNAALVIADPSGTTDVAVLELFNPVFDPASPGVTYDVQVLAEWQKELEVDFHEAPGDLSSLPATFAAASLFIDDCPTTSINCLFVPGGPIARDVPMCWNYSLCMPCEPFGNNQPSYCATYDHWKQQCDSLRPDCNGHCAPTWGWFMPVDC